MTWQRVVKDKFILVASLNLSPVEPVLPTFSLPAKSTMFNLLIRNLTLCLPPSTISLLYIFSIFI